MQHAAMACCAPGRPAALLDGLERVSALSRVARAQLFPQLLEARAADLLDGRATGFDECAKGLGDIARIRGMLEDSPYAAVLDVAFPKVVT